MAWKAVIFDFDGVLAESLAIKVAAFGRLFDDLDDERRELALDYYRRTTGVSRLIRIAHVHKEFLGRALSETEIADQGEVFRTLVEEAVIACPEVAGASRFLEAHHGKITLLVLSGTPEAELKRVVAGRSWSRFFGGVYGSPPGKEKRLPEIVARHGLAPRETLFIGDGAADLAGARAGGVDFVGRVPPGAASPFPAEVPTVEDLNEFQALFFRGRKNL